MPSQNASHSCLSSGTTYSCSSKQMVYSAFTWIWSWYTKLMSAHLSIFSYCYSRLLFLYNYFLLPVAVLDEIHFVWWLFFLSSLFYPVHEHVCTDCRLVSPNVHWKTSVSSLASWSEKKWTILGNSIWSHFKYVRSLPASGIFTHHQWTKCAT